MFGAFGALLVLLLLASTAVAQQKVRVAVLNFDYGAVQSSVAAIFGTNVDVGKGISDLLVQKLVQDGKYEVIERNAIDKVLAEQNFSNSNRADPATAAKIGRILGVNAIIVGRITQFGRENTHTNVAGNALGVLGHHWGFGNGRVGRKSSKAVVAITARLIDTSTGQILAAVTGTGESKRSGLLLAGGGNNYGGAGNGSIDMGSSNFAATILGEAVHQAVDSVGQQLDDKAASLPTVKLQIKGLVAYVGGNTLVLDVGSKAGVKVGDKLIISRKLMEIKDPATGAIIKTLTKQLGTATVTEVDQKSSTATYSGSAPVKIGDMVSNQ